MITLARRGVLCVALLFAASGHAGDCDGWPEWQRFKQLYLSADGRVIDAASGAITVSEGQAYALVFALIANDAQAFERILSWTQNNLAAGDLEHTRAAWKWGLSRDGRWTVLDANSASDADLWMAYALGEAAVLWRSEKYARMSRSLSDLILRDEMAFVPGLGATLLPGPKGFVTAQTWRLNASYLPLQVLRALGLENDHELWRGVIDSSRLVIVASAPRGFAVDWIDYTAAGFKLDAAAATGSFGAIRVYLWTGMLADDDPAAHELLARLAPAVRRAAELPPPESVDALTLEARGEGPPGFSAALLPMLSRQKLASVSQRYRQDVEARALKDDQHYYSDVLSLFGVGWADGRYSFDRMGRLRVKWTSQCRAH
jgi:endoglucanase